MRWLPLETKNILRHAFVALALLLTLDAKASLQFDVFLGYDGTIREGGWFPAACEIFNDGAPFNGIIEISSGSLGSDQVRKISVELPTNTRKRIVVPLFASASNFGQWSARLLDERGKVRAESPNLPTKVLAWEGVLVGALARTFPGMPLLPEVRVNGPQSRMLEVARLLPEQFPDSPFALEGLTAVYLNSEKALDLKVNQVTALLSWVNGGGQLIVSVEQIPDITAAPWLQQLLPCVFQDVSEKSIQSSLQEWVRRAEERPRTWRPGNVGGQFAPDPYAALPPDPNFSDSPIPVFTGKLRDGRARLSADGVPLIIDARRGRGRVTVLAFNPEREPFRSWKTRPWFWAKLLEVAPEKLGQNFNHFGGWSIDGVFGALLDTDQVRKLPVEWLLLLLVGYLVVIGPFDQYWLKKINRQMLTWITFPAYVVFFSFLIYFIGYKLRAGATEWNEIHLVDILPKGDEAQLRGRTFAAIYSSANARYPLANPQPYATLRGEFSGVYGNQSSGRATVEQTGNNFRAEIYVPVWTSQLYISDWLKSAPVPIRGKVILEGSRWAVTVENLLDQPLTETRLFVDGKAYDLGTVPARDRKIAQFERQSGRSITQFAQENGRFFQMAVDSRRSALGADNRGRLNDPALTAEAASFASLVFSAPGQQRGFIYPEGLDLSQSIEHGDAVLMGFTANQSPIQPIRQFNPPRGKKSTLWRLAIPVPELAK